MQIKRISLLVVFTLLVCSVLYGQENTTKIKKTQKIAPNTTQTVSDSTKKSTRKIVHKKIQKTPKTRSTSYGKVRRTTAPHASTNWKMARLKNREKFANDWINHLQEELSQYRQERSEIRKGMKNVLQQDIQEKLEAKAKLEREQQEQLRAREREIENLQQMQNSIDTTK